MFRKLCRRVQNNQLECKVEKLRCKVSRLENDQKAFETEIRKERKSDKITGRMLAFVVLAFSIFIWCKLEDMNKEPIFGVPGVDFAANSAYALSLFALYLATRSTGAFNLVLVMFCIAVSIIVTP